MSASPRHDLHGRSSEPIGARAWMAGICGPHDLEVRGRGRLGFRHDGNRLSALSTSVGVVEYGLDVEIGVDAGTPLRCFSVSLPLTGEQELTVAGRTWHSYPGRGCIVAPCDTQSLRISGRCRKLIVAIERASLHTVLESMLLRPLDLPLRFEHLSDTTAGATASWWHMVRHLIADLENPQSLYRDPALAPELERTLIRGLLLSQPNSYSAALRAAQDRALPAHVVKLRDFLLANAKEAISSADFPVAAGTSRSRLYEDFRTHLGVTPFAFLKRHRLHQVRTQLLTGRHACSVSDIAMDWGFFHLGRFAHDYATLFGELPSVTARRRRPR